MEPIFTQKERENYTRQKDKAHFSSPEQEFRWARITIKTCSKCNIDKNLTSYQGNTSGTDAFDKVGKRLRRPECSECTKQVAKGKTQAKKFAADAGIPYKAPEGTKCAICKTEAKSGNGLVFDHCHRTNTFRGYCCNSCNRSMGVLGDNVEGLIKVMNYLLKSEPTTISQEEDGTLKINE